jgi:hypothetical protein
MLESAQPQRLPIERERRAAAGLRAEGGDQRIRKGTLSFLLSDRRREHFLLALHDEGLCRRQQPETRYRCAGALEHR